MKLPEHGPWELPVVGFEVLHITFAFLIDIVAYVDGGKSCAIHLGDPFELSDHAERIHLDVSKQAWEDLTSVLTLRHDKIERASASNDGHLEVRFESGRKLGVGPDRDYENWQIGGPGFILICMPGGIVAVWDTDKPGTRVRFEKGRLIREDCAEEPQ